jgi:Protein of unknown function (DUF2845)
VVLVYARQVIVKRLLLGAVLAVGVGGSLALAEDSMRCGSKLVSEGDAKDKVRALCGEPTDIALRGMMRRSPSYRYGSWPYEHEYYGPGWEDLPVEIWTYNLGSHKLVRKLRFVGDQLEEIETAGYGY